MKLLAVNGYFRLPEDFTGTLDDALEMHLNYRRSKGLAGNSVGVDDTDHRVIMDEDPIQLELLCEFLDKCAEGPYKWRGSYQVIDIDYETGDVVDLMSNADG